MKLERPSCGGATQVVELTPVGRAAVAVVLVAGPTALSSVDPLFQSVRGEPLAEVPVGKMVLGRWGGPDGEELVVCRRTEDEVEIHCHGGTAAVRGVIERLVERGCRRTIWQDWLRQAEADPIRAAAHIAIAAAPTARTAAILLDQFDGALSRTLRAVLADVSAGRWSDAAKTLDDVLAFRDLGRHLTAPWQVVLAGRTNVGKSSLLNALAGYQRAIVSPLAGTTRDVLTLNTAIDGWPVQLMDTAGLSETDDALEAAGMALAGSALSTADLVLFVDDGADFSLALSTRAPQICVRSKIDLVTTTAHRWSEQETDGEKSVFFTSAMTGEGIDSLLAAIGQALVPTVPAAGAAMPFLAEQVAALDHARRAVHERDPATAANALQSLLSN